MHMHMRANISVEAVLTTTDLVSGSGSILALSFNSMVLAERKADSWAFGPF